MSTFLRRSAWVVVCPLALSCVYATEDHPVSVSMAVVPVVRVSGIEAVRRLGFTAASRLADLVLDINCPHCADVFGSAMSDLGKHADATSAEVVIRWWPRHRDPLASDLTSHVLATANRTEGSGYKGRCGLFELLSVDEVLRAQIAAGATAVDLRNAAVARGMRALAHTGAELVAAGRATAAEVERVIHHG